MGRLEIIKYIKMHMRNYKRFILCVFSFIFYTNGYGQHTLFNNGKSCYTIVIDPNASVSEQTAANELQNYIYQVSDVKLPISNNVNKNGNNIYVGWNTKVAALTKETKPLDNDESFTYKNINDNILIYGGSQRGTMYGVFSFLEQQLGIHWYTNDYTFVPNKKIWSFNSLLKKEKPAFKYRLVYYHDFAIHTKFCAHNRLNSTWNTHSTTYGNFESYYGAHTMKQYVSAKDYFSTHPEYFSLMNGKRISNGQLCLSNPDVLKICIKKLKEKIAQDSTYWVYSLSQDDNDKPCQCQKCKKLEEQYGGHSGLMIWFVNQVADVIKKDYPTKYIGTFAYNYSRKAPSNSNIKPHDNVVIRLCDVECCFAHPLKDGCIKNASFEADLKNWSKLTSNLYIWDYVVDFYQFLSPWPNFNSLSKNLKLFQQYNAIGILEEGNYVSQGGEFSELKAWILAKLLWNPDQDVNILVKQFISDYYGTAAPYIQQYFDLCQSLVKNDTHITIHSLANNSIYTDCFICQGLALLNKAKDAANSFDIAKRVDFVRLQILYLKFARNKDQSLNDGSYSEFIELIKKYKPNIRETMTTDKFLTSEGIK